MDVAELLRRNREADLLRFTTAGSVDDGKSTLIGRLLHDCKGLFEDHLQAARAASVGAGNPELELAYLLDGLKSEREQGITIDVAYRYFATERRRFIIADTPGHEQYTRNMVTGASTANLAVVLVDARKGVLTQSKRHGFIASLLEIPHVVLAVNKMDLVDYSREVYDAIRAEYAEYAAKLSLNDLTFIPVSALRGDNVVIRSERMPWYEGPSFLAHLEAVYIGADTNLVDFRFPVQLVLRPHQDFRGYAGRVGSGIVRVGDELMAMPSGRTGRVRRIVTHDGDLDYAFPPQSITLCLQDELDISRGDMLVHPNNMPHLAREVEAMLVWMTETPFDPKTPYLLRHTTRTVRAECTRLHYRIDPNDLHRQSAETLALNEIGRVSLSLFQPILCDAYDRNRRTGSFILIDPVDNNTVAAGMLIERRGRSEEGRASRPVSLNIVRQAGEVAEADRFALLRQHGATVWFTGLSGSGKSTIAYALEKRLTAERHVCAVLDGDNVRHGLNRDLGFSPEDRRENIRRVAEVAKLMSEAGLIVITSFISPYREDRAAARAAVGEERFFEVFVDAPLAVCEGRDPKGLYRKARSGEIPEFTGVGAPYEAPEAPDVRLFSDAQHIADCVEAVVHALNERGVFG